MRLPLARTALAVLLLVAACKKGTPTAPAGSTLTISANPVTIGLTGTSVITVVGRKPDGNPMIPGTEIRLSSDHGTLDPVITTTDSNGVATARLHGDGRPGTAAVKATFGDGSVTAEVDVQIGQSTDSQPTVIVNANPSNIPVLGTSTITVIARNADNTPVAQGTEVILTTSLGSLKPQRPSTKADGTATSTLTAGSQAGSATVGAIVGSSAQATATVTIRDSATDISVQANPSTVPAAGTTSPIDLTAFVTNSQGQALQGAPVTFQSERGTLETAGVTFTDTNGIATNKLDVTQAQIAGVTSFQVTATTPRSDGTLLSASVTINVQ